MKQPIPTFGQIRKFIKNMPNDPGRTFAVLALVFGLIFVFTMPPFMVPDERVHFYRAYQIGEGHFVSETRPDGQIGGVVPEVPYAKSGTEGLYPRYPTSGYIKDFQSKKFVPFPSSALYSPAGYVPQSLGIDVGRVIFPSLGVMSILGRIFNLFAYIIFIWFAIKIAVQGKWAYAIVGLFPMSIQQAASLSPDVMTIGLAFLTISIIHRLFVQSDVISKKQIVLLIALASANALVKQTNIILMLPLIFLPKHLFRNSFIKLKIVLGTALVCILTLLVWYFTAKYFYKDLTPADQMGQVNVDPVLQLKGAILHPLSFASVLFKSFVFEGFRGISLPDFYFNSTFGFFSFLLYKMPISFAFLGYMTLALSLLGDDLKVKTIVRVRISVIFLATMILSVLAIVCALYFTWTPVGAKQISGIQGRYFIPLIPMLIPIFNSISHWLGVSYTKPYRLGVLFTSIATLNLIVATIMTYKFFY